jgi:peptidoglycan/LPS O-acetylase OafA/YrhL
VQTWRASAENSAVADGLLGDARDLTSRSAAAGRLSALDGLRGLAAVGVVVFHGYPRVGFWMGSLVDLFFVISGFVITRMLIGAPSGHQVSLHNFWVRRILRIWPVYFLTLGSGAAVLAAVALANPAFGIPKDLWKCFLFVQFTEAYGPYDGSFLEMFARYTRWLGHSWSLAVEEQFYLIWPLMLLLFRGTWGALGLCLVLAIGCWHVNLAGWPPVTLATRGLGLAIGSAFAIGEVRLGLFAQDSRWRHCAAVVSGLALCVGLLYEAPRVAGRYAGVEPWMMVGPPSVQAHDLLAFSMVYAGLVGWLLAYRDGLLSRVLSGPGLPYLGSLSYALYMYHFPLMALFGRTGMGWPGMQHIGLLENLAYWFVLLAAAHLSRERFESVFNRRKHDYPLYVPKG